MDRQGNYNKPWILQRADPYVCKADGGYYFTASVPAFDRIILRYSKTLRGLGEASERVIWKKHDHGPMSENIWAPELHWLYGGWYIYYAGGEVEDQWHIRPYVLKLDGTDPMKDEWVEAGPMRPADTDEFSFRTFSLDATIFQVNGEYYYVWAEKVSVGKQISNLYISRMESPVKLATDQVLLTSPDYDWERHGFWVNEGPGVLFHGDDIWLTYSASDTGPAYSVGMLHAKKNSDLLDPRSWEKSRYPVLSTDQELGIYGPGHNCFVKDENENDQMIVHARTKPEIEGNPLDNPDRHAFILPVRWNEDTPVFSFRGEI